MKNVPRYIVIHCSDASYKIIFDQFLPCNGWHKDRGFPLSSLGYYIGYQRIITGDKNYQARLDTDEGAHCNQVINGLSMNFQSLGICVGMDGDIEMPTPMQYALLQKQVWDWQDQYGITNDRVYFHRFFSPSKTCPGSLITADWLKTLLTRPTPVVVAPKPVDTMCMAQEAIIADQKVQIAWYISLINALKALLNK